MVLGATEASVRGFDARTKRVRFTLKPIGSVADLQLAAGGGALMITSPAGTNRVYSLAGARPALARSWRRKRSVARPKRGITQGLSGDGSYLIRGDVRGQVRGYELKSHKLKWLVKATRVAIGPAGKVAGCLRGRTLTRVDAMTGQPAGKPVAFGGAVLAFAVAGENTAAIVRRGNRCRLTATGRLALTLPCPKRPHLAWSPDGAHVALGGVGVAQVLPLRALRPLFARRSISGWHGIAFVDAATFAVANAPQRGQVSLYRLPR